MENQRRNHVEIEMNEEVLAMGKPVFITECFIYRVPREMRDLNPDAYTPKVVSIGPFYYGNDNLRSMESQKQLYCHKFIERAKVETSFDKLMSCVQDLEPSIRACYSHNIMLTPQQLVKVIFLDCCFIFELFLISYPFIEQTDYNEDAIQSTTWLENRIVLDLVLLENQLPFFVLEKLYNLAFASRQNDTEPKHPSFLDITFNYFENYNNMGLSAADATGIEHFTDLLRTFHLPPYGQISSRGKETITRFNSATALNEAGSET